MDRSFLEKKKNERDLTLLDMKIHCEVIDKNRVPLVQGQTFRSMEKNRKYRNKCKQ